MSEEPAAKKPKTGWENHTLNCSHALMKESEGRHFKELGEDPIATLEGIGPKATEVFGALGIKTINDLATYKFFLMARALKALSETEVKGGRLSDSVMNVDLAVDKADETKSLTEIVESPLHVFQGLTPAAETLFKDLGVKTIGDLADLKYCRWAEAIVELGKYEHQLTETERKEARELKKLE